MDPPWTLLFHLPCAERSLQHRNEIWRRAFSITCSSMNRSLPCLRYVGNRLWMSERRVEQLPGVRALLNSHFYPRPLDGSKK